MNCKSRSKIFLSNSVFLDGKESAINKQAWTELGTLPKGGKTSEVLVKCSNANHHTSWMDLLTLINNLGLTFGDTDWIETATSVYNDYKPIGIGTPTPTLTNALTVVGKMHQSTPEVFIASGMGMGIPYFPVGAAAAVLGTVKTLSPYYSFIGAASNSSANSVKMVARNEASLLPGNLKSKSITLDDAGIVLDYFHLPGGGVDFYSNIKVEHAVEIKVTDTTPTGKMYRFGANGGMGMFNSTTNALIYRLPSVDGIADEVLTTNGTGNLYWAAPTSGGSGVLYNIYTSNGVLTSLRTVDCNGYNFSVVNGSKIEFSGATILLDGATNINLDTEYAVHTSSISTSTISPQITLNGLQTQIIGSTELKVVTPNVHTSSPLLQIGDILTLTDLTGTAEWMKPKVPVVPEFSYAMIKVATSPTLAQYNTFVLCGTGPTCVINLPTASVPGKTIIVYQAQVGTAIVEITPEPTEWISGLTAGTPYILNTLDECITLVSDGNLTWRITAKV